VRVEGFDQQEEKLVSDGGGCPQTLEIYTPDESLGSMEGEQANDCSALNGPTDPSLWLSGLSYWTAA